MFRPSTNRYETKPQIQQRPPIHQCLDLLEKMRWDGKPKCPHCEHEDKIYEYKDGKTYKCSSCKRQFNVRTATIFYRSHIPLQDWFYAMYIFVNHKKGISSIQLSKDLNTTQSTAWFMLQRIRHAMTDRSYKLFGQVEVDETFVGGKNKNRHYNKRAKNNQGRALVDKSAIYGMVERGGRVKILHIKKLSGVGMRALLRRYVEDTSVIYTDEYRAYNGLDKMFEQHFVVNHSQGQYVNDHMHTNTIEGFWSQLKRGIFGIYHHTSKHLRYRYCHEFEFRWNTRKLNDQGRFFEVIGQTFGKRLDYEMATCRTRKW